MDPNTTMETIGSGANALTKLLEIVNKAFSPRWTRKQADADAYADQRKLQTIRDNPDFCIEYTNGIISERSLSAEELIMRAEQRERVDIIRQESNIERVLINTARELQGHESVSDEPVDDDWIVRFFNIVKDVSNEEMQLIWSKILAGEISNSGNFSLRTLEAVRNLSRREAEVFRNILPFIIEGGGDYFVSSNASLLKRYELPYEDIMLLDECGLMISDGMLTLNIPVSGNSSLAHNGCCALLTEMVDGEKVFSFGVYSLTTAGRELYRILKINIEANEAYFFDFAECVFNENKHSKLKIKK